jgi:hypothetical protein
MVAIFCQLVSLLWVIVRRKWTRLPPGDDSGPEDISGACCLVTNDRGGFSRKPVHNNNMSPDRLPAVNNDRAVGISIASKKKGACGSDREPMLAGAESRSQLRRAC